MSPPKFDGSSDFGEFKACLITYFVSEDITDDAQKSSVLLASVSKLIFNRLERLLAPRSVTTVRTNELLDLLENHYSSNRSNFTGRHVFYSALRHPKETPEHWAARLQGLASNCEFGHEEMMLIRDIFVSRYRAGPVQNRLLEEDPMDPQVDLAKLMKLATTKEEQLHETKTQQITNSGKLQNQKTLGVRKQRSPKTGVRMPRTPKTGVKQARTPKTGVKQARTQKTGVKQSRTPKTDVKKPGVRKPRTKKPKVEAGEYDTSGLMRSSTCMDNEGRSNAQFMTGIRATTSFELATGLYQPTPSARIFQGGYQASPSLPAEHARITQPPQCRRCGEHHSLGDCLLNYY